MGHLLVADRRRADAAVFGVPRACGRQASEQNAWRDQVGVNGLPQAMQARAGQARLGRWAGEQ